jgi:hypothetical protein
VGAALARPRARRCLVATALLLACTSGCGPGGDGRPTLTAADVARPLQSATGIGLKPVRPPFEVPGLPELATTLTGGTEYESLTVLVFFEREGAARVLGSGRTPPGMTVIARSNVVVLYHASAGAADDSPRIRRALAGLMARA